MKNGIELTREIYFQSAYGVGKEAPFYNEL